MIRLGNVDAMVVGASEACIHPLAVAGFARARSLSTGFNDTPEQASRPFDKRRDGFVIGEGAGVLVLEELDFARKRGARILAEVLGYGMSCDADHMTKPLVDGWGAEVAMRQGLMRVGETLARAEGERSDGKEVYVDYINAHATSTVLGDVAELRAIKRAVSAGQDSGIQPQGTEGHTKGITGEPDRNIRRPLGTAAQGHLNISSTKSSIGHLLGAAGSIEAIFTILALREGILPPTLNLVDAGNPAACEAETATKAADGGYEDDPYDGINFVPHKAQKMQPRDKEGRRRVGLSNSFGFGGTNASLVFGEWADQ